MTKQVESWSVSKLLKEHLRINFPEYQREPNVWSRDAKCRLIDSMVREFDIASFYFYENADSSVDCVDGRQRIGAILSFLGENKKDRDNGFEFKVLNEIYTDTDHPFSSLANCGFRDIEERGRAQEDVLAQRFVDAFLDYEITVVTLAASGNASEFNVQFTRLNLGTIVNSGEKLNAMVGDLRDLCFDEMGSHPFLQSTDVATRRYSREQLAAQIVAQIFSMESGAEDSKARYARTRHIDLQAMFKNYSELGDTERGWIRKTTAVMNLLKSPFEESGALRSRALVVSTVLLAYELEITSEQQALELAEFIDEFVCRLRWQILKGLDVDSEYRYLVDFQRHVTQASVEKPAVQARADTLRTEFDRWRASGGLRGDAEYRRRGGGNPSEECRE